MADAADELLERMHGWRAQDGQDTSCQGVLDVIVLVPDTIENQIPNSGGKSQGKSDAYQSPKGLTFGKDVVRDHAKRRLDLAAAQACISQFVGSLAKRFAFTYEPLLFTVDDEQDCLRGRMRFCDALGDEWWAAYVIRELTAKFPLAASVSDEDGEFLLIEGAQYLPEWISPENAQFRVLLYQGKVHIASPSQVPCASPRREELLIDSANFIAANPRICRVSDALESEIWRRYVGENETSPGRFADQSKHRATCLVPRSCASVFERILAPVSEDDDLRHLCNDERERLQVRLVALAAHAFHHRDAADLKAASRMKHFRLREKPPSAHDTNVEDEEVQLIFPRVAYAQLLRQPFPPPKCFLRAKGELSSRLAGIPALQDVDEAALSAGQKSALVGLKLACGMEMLYCAIEAQKKDMPIGGNEPKELSNLESASFSHPFMKHFAQPSVEMHLAAERLIRRMEDRNSIGDMFKRVLDRAPFPKVTFCGNSSKPDDSDDWLNVDPDEFEALLESQASTTSVDGLEHREGVSADMQSEIVAAMEAFLGSSSGLQGVEFSAGTADAYSKPDNENPDQVAVDFDKLLSILQNPSNEECDDSDNAASTPQDEATNDEEFIHAATKVMDEQLVGHGEAGHSFVKTRTGAEKHGQEAMLAPVDVDMNLVQSLLESVSLQHGESGPASNLLCELGLVKKQCTIEKKVKQ